MEVDTSIHLFRKENINMKPTVVFQTDFGSGGGGVLAGVVKTIDPEVSVYDFDHNIEPFNIRQSAYQISTMIPYWPSGTIFVSVVDPGVGTHRKSCVAKLKNGSYVVTPDNGILTSIIDDIVEIRRIDESVNRMPGSENVYIFHGRDVYAYTAAKLASGIISYNEVGPQYSLDEITILPLTNIKAEVKEGYACGGIYNFDVAYGCCRVNIYNKDFQNIGKFQYGDIVNVTISDKGKLIFKGKTTYEKAFGYAPRHQPFICGDIQHGDRHMLRFTINDHNFIDEYAPFLKNNTDKAVDFKFEVEKITL